MTIFVEKYSTRQMVLKNIAADLKALNRSAKCICLLIILLSGFSPSINAQSNNWEMLPGFAKDIGAGADGSIWAIGANPVGNRRDFGVYRWTGTSWQGVDVGGVRIDVDRRGNPWIVNAAGQVFRRINNRWELLPGSARDIGIGPDGSVWSIGTNPVKDNNFGIYRWTGNFWERVDGGGVRIDVDRKGNPWIVNAVGQVFRRINNNWEKLPGSGRDIGIGSDGSVWVIGTNPAGNGRDFGVYKWTGSIWQGVDGGGVQITVDRFGMPWIVNSNNNVFKRK